MHSNPYLQHTALLNFTHPAIGALIAARGWSDLPEFDQIGAVYGFVRDEIRFGYNADDALIASRVLADGYGQCNTKTTLLMALLRGVGVACQFHGFTIDKALQRGVVPELVYGLAPASILHSWVEVWHGGRWVVLEGFILDAPVLAALQRAFPEQDSLCAYGVGTEILQAPQVDWVGGDTFIQKTGINADLGVFDAPDEFYTQHQQLRGVRGLLYRWGVRHWMNLRVQAMRRGRVPWVPGIIRPCGSGRCP